MSEVLHIERLGAQGDGIATVADGQVFVPFTLPGETVRALADGKGRAELLEVVEPAADRVAPACRHFGTCGGCSLQHMATASYLEWKRGRVVEALRHEGIDAPVGQTLPCDAGTRRRAVFAAARGPLLGFRKAMSHAIVDIGECPILLPAIERALPVLRELVAILARGKDPFRLTVTSTASGLDVAAGDCPALDEPTRRAASAFAIANAFARLSVDGEVVVEPKKPAVMVEDIAVHLPPAGFLQAVADAEEAMAGLAMGHLGRAKSVADLFSGSGAFSLRLARRHKVHAVEADAGALAALDRAVRSASGLKPVTIERRDLFRRPLLPRELAQFDGVLFDPPRAGAEAQARHIAASVVPQVVAVSCNPATLARDLRILVDGGYRVEAVTPVDQFLWSPHVEAVALLGKPRRRR
jgi:23S rRNA (uracil1939-C5)-methyltransferase